MNRNKKSILSTAIGTMCLLILVFSCKPTAEDILKKYEDYSDVQTNRAEVGLTFTNMNRRITYSHPKLNSKEEYIKTLADRWFVVDAENPSERLPIKVGTLSISTRNQPNTYVNNLDIGNIKERYLLICFEGIDSSELEEAETPPLFFIVENKKDEKRMLTEIPRTADDLFTASYERTSDKILTVKKIIFETDGISKLVLTDEKGVEITLTRPRSFEEYMTSNNWFVREPYRVSIRKNAVINMIPVSTEMKIEFTPSDDEILLFMFHNSAGDGVPIGIGSGRQLHVRQNSLTKKYTLLVEETAKQSPPPIINENEAVNLLPISGPINLQLLNIDTIILYE